MSLVGKNIGNYKVIAKIGEGGMGSVYMGEHPMIGKKVAIKTLHPDLAVKEDIVARFFTEAKAVNDIAHPNIVDVVDFGKMFDDELGADVVYFVMEFLDGEGLNSRLKNGGLTPRETVHILLQCTSALSASHKKNIVHRDLKPDNIYLVPRGSDKNYAKLLDFGIAKLTGTEGENSQHKTRAGLVIGTPAYMSPEQCEGKGNIDARSDVYSLGVVMYEMLTGRLPFVGEGFGEILVAHLTRQPDLPSSIRADVPASLEAIVMHAIEKDKNLRFQSMDEFGAALSDPAAHMESYGSPSGRADTFDEGHAPVSVEHSGARRLPTGQGARPTTLSGASGEVGGGAAAPKSKAPVFVALGLVVAVGGGAAAFFATRGSAPAPTLAAAIDVPAVPATPKAPTIVKVMVDSSPHGAKILRAGMAEPLGETPYKMELKPSDPDFDIVIELAGYKSETRNIGTQRDRDMLVTLTKIEAPVASVVAAPVVPVKTPSSTSRHAGGKKKGEGGAGGAGADEMIEPKF